MNNPLINDTQRVAVAVKAIYTDVDMLHIAAENAIEAGVPFENLRPALDQARRDLNERYADLQRLVNQ